MPYLHSLSQNPKGVVTSFATYVTPVLFAECSRLFICNSKEKKEASSGYGEKHATAIQKMHFCSCLYDSAFVHPSLRRPIGHCIIDWLREDRNLLPTTTGPHLPYVAGGYACSKRPDAKVFYVKSSLASCKRHPLFNFKEAN
nr:uncharacterized protein LOC129380634 [Dermacentor andersoni]